MLIITIGRNSNNDILIQDPSLSVSANHAEIKVLRDQSLFFVDKSTNGTMVGGKLLHNGERKVQRGTVIVFPNGTALDWNLVPLPTQLSNIKKEITIGKNPDNDLRLNSDKASRYHAQLLLTDKGAYYLFDQSLNGVKINGQRIAKYRDVRVRRGDEVVFAGGEKLNWKKIPKTGLRKRTLVLAFVLALVVSGGIVGYKTLGSESISERYLDAVVLIENTYLLAYVDGDRPLYVIGNGANGNFDLVEYGMYKNGTAAVQPFAITGTGFFVGDKGRIVTNRHVAMPWEAIIELNKASFQSQIGLKELQKQNVVMNPDIVPIPLGLGVYLNNMMVLSSSGNPNFIESEFIRTPNEKDLDLALLQTKNGFLPYGAGSVNPKDIISASDQIKLDDEVTVIGFPLGADLALDNNEGKIKTSSTKGTVSKIVDRDHIQYSATTFGGASGSPVFNKNGKLVAVHYAGRTETQGYNFGVNAYQVRKLLLD